MASSSMAFKASASAGSAAGARRSAVKAFQVRCRRCKGCREHALEKARLVQQCARQRRGASALSWVCALQGYLWPVRAHDFNA